MKLRWPIRIPRQLVGGLRSRLADLLRRELALVAIPSAIILLAVFYAAYRVVDPLPPTKFVIAAGTPGSSYSFYAQRYRELLARDGIELEIRPFEGALDNTSFWVAVLLDRAIFVLVPVIAALIPIVGFAPATYRWLNRRHIWRWYKTLAALERDIAADPRGQHLDQHCARLEEIERRVRTLKVSPPFASEVYDLRLHLKLLRERFFGDASEPCSWSRVR